MGIRNIPPSPVSCILYPVFSSITMSKLIYLQCPTGISGDMCLGALVNLGVPVDYLRENLYRLGIDGEFRLQVEVVQRNGQAATKVNVDVRELNHTHHHEHHHHHHGGTRHLPEIATMIRNAKLPPQAEAWSLAVFHQLAVAEGAVHGIAPEKVHFHEVGAVDAIVDIVGTCLGLDWLGIDTTPQGLPMIYCSAFPTGGGIVRAAHGLMPVPVPAVLKLWEMRGCPVYSNGIDRELVTPTGAAIATTLAQEFGSPPPMRIKQIGLGAGSLNLSLPNILRMWLGVTDSEEWGTTTLNRTTHHTHDHHHSHGDQQHHHFPNHHHHHNHGDQKHDHSPQPSPGEETIAVLETQIDDLNPQAIGYLFDRLFAAGALDVFTQAIGMKKSRPGFLLTVICQPSDISLCEDILFQETTTIGIRHSLQQRTRLHREIQQVPTEYGLISVKVAWQNHQKTSKIPTITNIQPEYEDCAKIARDRNLPWREVQRIALQSWYNHNTHA